MAGYEGNKMARGTLLLIAVLGLGCGELQPPPAVKLTVTLQNLTDTRPRAYTNNAAMTFRAAVQGGTPQTFALYRGAEKVMDLTGAQADAVVQTNALGPGTYELTAQAMLNGYVYSSEVRTLVIDRTPPKILTAAADGIEGRFPAPGAADVWVGESVQVVFDELLDPNTVNANSVKLYNGGTQIPAAVSLARLDASDPSGFIILVNPTTNFTPPITVSVTMSGTVSDLAGNAATLPVTAWTFTVPAWRVLGNGPLDALTAGNTPASWPVVVLDRDDDPVVAWEEKNTNGETRMYVRSWSHASSEWVGLGQGIGPVEPDPAAPAHALVVSDTGDPIVAWRQPESGTVNIYANIWATANWQPMGGGISAKDGATPSGAPALGANGGQPFLAFHEEGETAATDIYVYGFDGSAWAPVAPDPIGKGSADNHRYPCVGVTATDPRPVLGYQVEVAGINAIESALLNRGADPDKFDVLAGGRLSGDTARSATSCSIAVNGSEPWIAWDQNLASGTGVFLSQHASTAWQPNTTSGTSDGNTSSSVGDLELLSGIPYLVKQQASDVVVKKYEASAWANYGPAFSTLVSGATSLSQPSLSIRGAQIAVAWTALHNGERKVFVAKYNTP